MPNSILANPSPLFSRSTNHAPRDSVKVLMLAIEHGETQAFNVCARCVLKSIYDHLHTEYLCWPNANGEAMSTVLVLSWDLGYRDAQR